MNTLKLTSWAVALFISLSLKTTYYLLLITTSILCGIQYKKLYYNRRYKKLSKSFWWTFILGFQVILITNTFNFNWGKIFIQVFCQYLGFRFCTPAVTGSIGSGKTSFCKLLIANHFVIIDADVISKKISNPKMPAYNSIVRNFGPQILNTDSTINRSALKELCFNDPKLLKMLNRITHFYIIREIIWEIFKNRILSFNNRTILDASLLFQTHIDFICCPVITIFTETENQLERLKLRDPSTPVETLKKIISSQLPGTVQSRKSDHTIVNNSSLNNFYRNIQETFQVHYNIELKPFSY